MGQSPFCFQFKVITHVKSGAHPRRIQKNTTFLVVEIRIEQMEGQHERSTGKYCRCVSLTKLFDLGEI